MSRVFEINPFVATQRLVFLLLLFIQKVLQMMKHQNTNSHPQRFYLYLPPNHGNSEAIHQAALALPTLFVIMFLAIIISLWVSTAEAFIPTPSSTHTIGTSRILSSTKLFDVSAQEALERTKRKLQELQNPTTDSRRPSSLDPRIEQRVREYLSFPANEIKRELKANGLPTKGKKPDLAKRLAEFEYLEEYPDEVFGGDQSASSSDSPQTKYLDPKKSSGTDSSSPEYQKSLDSFCGLPLSAAAGAALGKANFDTPTPIQKASLQTLCRGDSAVLHAETGSGKTLAYLLPITEAMWKDNEMLSKEKDEKLVDDDNDLWFGLILTPTRELASQVAGVASALAPPGSVRLVTNPTNLMSEGRYWKERRGDRVDDPEFLAEETQSRGRGSPPRLFVGSAKAIMGSLYGDGKMPASPTRKPAAKELLSRTRWVVLDEVDRLLTVKNKKGLSQAQRNQRARKSGYDAYEGGSDGVEKTGPLHEKPAAVLTAAVARRTLGRAQIIAASATVGRSLKRELSRVLGLPPKEYPKVIQGDSSDNEESMRSQEQHQKGQHFDRAVTIPGSVQNFVLPVDASSTGKLLTSAFFAIKNLNHKSNGKAQKTLLVLTKGCGITTTNAIGALKHFRCQPEPQSLLDVLQDANGTDQLMDVHRKVSGSDGIGEQSSTSSNDGYLLVTGEDTVRGMHLDGLDNVVVVGRATGPDEYIHIAGRTGRAGKAGAVINVLSEAHASAIQGWEKMLNTEFIPISMEGIKSLE